MLLHIIGLSKQVIASCSPAHDHRVDSLSNGVNRIHGALFSEVYNLTEILSVSLSDEPLLRSEKSLALK